ncbi:MAG: hypothetical protein CMK09_15535 [Ponticaulis sp.]|nr:hypothetical protein [Ponticaulis sp.]
MGTKRSEEELSEWIFLLSKGDYSYFSKIYDNTYDIFFNVIRSILKCEDKTRDVIQLGYISIWKRSDTYCSSKGKAFTWMLVIMRNKALDELRRTKRQGSDQTLCDTIPDTSKEPDETTEMANISEILDHRLNDLPPIMSLIIRRRFLHGQTSQQIAEEFSLSPNTVRCWLRRGLLKLRQSMPVDRLDLAISAS